MGNVSVINNAGNNVKVSINEVNGVPQIIIDLVNGSMSTLADLKPGDVFSKAGVDYILLEHVNEDTCAVIRKELLPKEYNCAFGKKNNDWRCSIAKSVLNGDYLNALENDFGADNIVSHEIDLLSLDGLDDYGVDKAKVSLLTVDQYRKFRKLKVIGENMFSPWWLATPDSTPSGYSTSCVRCVYSCGCVDYDGYCWDGRALRPFFHLKSSTLVSKTN